jgi:hypothetical protein
MKTYTQAQLSRLFGRLHETNACPKHGSGNMAVCPKCDVVACKACAGGNDCPCDIAVAPKHYFVAGNPQNIDACMQCKKDIRDEVHFRGV